MKLALAGIAAIIVLVVVAFVVAVNSTSDKTPDSLRACLEKTNADVVHGEDGLAGLRRDLLFKTPPRVQRVRVGDNDGALLSGTGYTLVVMRARKSPTLDGDVALRVYHHADAFPIVAVETGDASDMVACTRTAR